MERLGPLRVDGHEADVGTAVGNGGSRYSRRRALEEFDFGAQQSGQRAPEVHGDPGGSLGRCATGGEDRVAHVQGDAQGALRCELLRQ